MKRRSNEVATGALVFGTLAIVAGILFALSAPGGRSPKRFQVFFDNAGAIKPGTEVLLAGRQVGQVERIESPVPVARRPEGHEELEALITVRVRKNAMIYQSVSVRMIQVGLLGQQMIDFVGGDETSGLAPDDATFVGERVAGLTDVADEAQEALGELKETLVNVRQMTSPGGELRETMGNAQEFTDKIKRQPWRLIRKTKEDKELEKEKEKEPEKRASAR